MPNVAARKPPARRTVAAFVQRPGIGSELGALDVEPAVACEGRAVAPHSRGSHTVEEIHAAYGAFHEVLGKAHAHEVARPVARQLGIHHLEDAIHVRLGFAYREAAN